MTLKDRTRYSLVCVATFSLAVFSNSIAQSVGPYWDWVTSLPDPVRWLERPFRWTMICVVGLYAVHRSKPRQILGEFGLLASPMIGIGMPFLACSPMLIVPGLMVLTGHAEINPDLSILRNVLFGAIIWPMGEEILFRGYAFGQLYRHGGMSFWAAALFIGTIFGVLHLGQASVQDLPLAREIGAVLIVSVGGVLFAWLYVRWNLNLWVAFGAHMFMNLWWAVFSLGDSPVGGWLPNVLRLLSVGLLITFTLRKNWLPSFLLPQIQLDQPATKSA